MWSFTCGFSFRLKMRIVILTPIHNNNTKSKIKEQFFLAPSNEHSFFFLYHPRPNKRMCQR